MLDRTDPTTRGRHAAAPVVDAVADDVVPAPPLIRSAGWFPDPDGAAVHRWWTGIAWTDFTQVVIEAPPAPITVETVEPEPEPEPEATELVAAETDLPARPRGRRALPLDVEAELAAIAAAPPAADVPPLVWMLDSGDDLEPEAARAPVLEAELELQPEPEPEPEPEPGPATEAPRAAKKPSTGPVPVAIADDLGPELELVRTPPRPAVAVQRYVPPPPVGNIPGRVALILALGGILAGVGVMTVPMLLPVSILLLIVAIITAIAALPKWGRRRGVAVVALLLGVAGLAVAPLALGFDNLQRLITGDLRPIGIDATFSAERSAGIGELVVLGDGVGVTVDALQCGVDVVTDPTGATHDSAGQYCIVTANIVNGSEMPVIVETEDVTVRVAGVDYVASAEASDLGGAVGMTVVDPTESVIASFVVDVPAEAVPDRVDLHPSWVPGTTITVDAAG